MKGLHFFLLLEVASSILHVLEYSGPFYCPSLNSVAKSLLLTLEHYSLCLKTKGPENIRIHLRSMFSNEYRELKALLRYLLDDTAHGVSLMPPATEALVKSNNFFYFFIFF